ncbi:hypothetical protein HPB49_012363 [Dermacentor silvarum]|uniref:Uncharacterized protein n=1 Tax=Dermacentor silvarum TaxID=543639 RepID=A0ACB8CF67_DERSI|nr:hypothetical protein HPB49_012363 [Dermacentor silvarum]
MPLRVVHGVSQRHDGNDYHSDTDERGGLTGAINYYRAFNNDSEQLQKFPYRPINVSTLILWAEEDAFLSSPIAGYNQEWLKDSKVMYYARAATMETPPPRPAIAPTNYRSAADRQNLEAFARARSSPRYVYYYGCDTRCYLYLSSRQVCYICFKPGHRADVCPTSDAVVCSNCAEPVIEDVHICEPKSALCKEAHPTRAMECKERLRKPKSPRARKQEEPGAEARNAGGRGRTRKRWFSRGSSSTSRSRSRSRSASMTRQAPETKKKQQKKTITKKEEDSKVSWKAHLFSASPTAPKSTNTQNDEVNELTQTIHALRAEKDELRQKLNELIDELKALRTGRTKSNPQTDETQSATIRRQEFATTMVAMNNALANLSNLVSNLQEEARKDRERLVQFTGMKSRTKPYTRPSADHGELP